MINDADLNHLKRCVDLAKEALEKGNPPFASILVSADGEVLFEDHNRAGGGDPTQHPEFAIARWAVNNLSQADRAVATVYTSGEHCPMCAAAHARVGLGRIVYASSMQQFTALMDELGVPPSPVRPLPIAEVIIDAQVEGPVPALTEELRKLHIQYYKDR